MSVPDLFHLLVACHIVTGAVGLVSFWIPVGGRKGGRIHRGGGTLFTAMMLVTGTFAVGMSVCTLIAPIPTHPHLVHHPELGSAPMIRAIFGWMMLYLAVLTVNLAWYGWLCVRHKRVRDKQRAWHNLALQGLLLVTAANCAWHGFEVGVPLLGLMSLVGFATVATNLYYLYKPAPDMLEWLAEHIKALIGAGISVYTAFFAFGAVRILPEAALTPALWATPLAVGLGLILYHRRAVYRGSFRTQ